MDVPKAPQSCRRVALKIEMDKKLKRKINKTEKEINLSRMKTPLLCSRHEKSMVLRGVECDLQQLNGKIDELAHLVGEQVGDKIKSKVS